jgi:hypothetical protein
MPLPSELVPIAGDDMPEAAGVLVVACPTAGLDYRIIHHAECPNLREYVSANALRWGFRVFPISIFLRGCFG